jgi:predicted branched-subunit amino acid permease
MPRFATTRAAYWGGFRDGAPFVLVVGPFGLVFGVVGAEAGLNLVEVMGFSILVIAGASQIAAVQMMSENAPTIVVIATALAVNLRMAMYSVALVPYLGAAPAWQRGFIAYFLVDQAYAVAATTYANEPKMTLAQRTAYFFGAVTPVCPLWYVVTFVGALVGSSIPPGYALDFAVPITFLALIAPLLRSLPHVVATMVSILATLAFAPLPFNTGLLAAAPIAMAAGAATELFLKRRRERGQQP